MDQYSNQLEKENERLRKLLSETQEKLDDITEAKNIEIPIEMIIRRSIDRQKNFSLTRANLKPYSFGHEQQTVAFHLPRQIGTTTAIFKACLKNFPEVDVFSMSQKEIKYIIQDLDASKIHANTGIDHFRGRSTRCIVVPNFSHKYSMFSLKWKEDSSVLYQCFSHTKDPCLVVLDC